MDQVISHKKKGDIAPAETLVPAHGLTV